MTPTVNETHDPALRSWVESANLPGADFPIQNLPLGVFRSASGPRIGVAIGGQVLDLAAAMDAGVLPGLTPDVAAAGRAPCLNAIMALGPGAWSSLRRELSRLLRAGEAGEPVGALLRPASSVEMMLPAEIGDYTDFYASVHHATNVGRMFRPDQPLMPNYKWVPIGYHGRASSVVPSGTVVRRPSGQLMAEGAEAPAVGPTRALDYEAELGLFIGPGNAMGETIPIGAASNQIFGFCLVNDWSARDIQRWEYQPLGPFLSKSFATSVSPWIVTAEALAPFRAALTPRAPGDPVPLPYLADAGDQTRGGVAVSLEVLLETRAMRSAGVAPHRVSRASALDLYWTPAQLVTHHASNGCNLRPGDLLASGTVSGPAEDSLGCLLELTARGSRPLTLPGGEVRRFLEDGDEVIVRGRCEAPGRVTIGFGTCRGRLEA